jgi:hypothetical protein
MVEDMEDVEGRRNGMKRPKWLWRMERRRRWRVKRSEARRRYKKFGEHTVKKIELLRG